MNFLKQNISIRKYFVLQHLYDYISYINIMNIGKNIKELRTLNKLTQTQLAEKLGTTQDTISLWELGKSKPDVDSLVALCGIFKVTPNDLLDFDK